jgi:hypothetical protein
MKALLKKAQDSIKGARILFDDELYGYEVILVNISNLSNSSHTFAVTYHTTFTTSSDPRAAIMEQANVLYSEFSSS